MIYQFRIWLKKEKCILYDMSLDGLKCTLNELLDEENSVFMRNVGHKDKNGKDMWEGDIVKTWDASGVPCFGGQNTVLTYHTYFTNPAYIEVIGNEWENPELVQIRVRP